LEKKTMQDIIVYIIVAASSYWLYRHFRGPKKKGSGSKCRKCPMA